MSEQVAEHIDAIDLALAAYRDVMGWHVEEITDHFLADFGELVEGLRRFPGEAGTLGMISVDEDFFLIVRVTAGEVRVLISDAAAADEWALAQEAIDTLRLVVPEDDTLVHAGDLGIVHDLGLSADDMVDLLDDDDLFPEEALSDIATELGFGDEFDEFAGLDEDEDDVVDDEDDEE